MKTLLLLSTILIIGCTPNGKRQSKDGYDIVTIEGCEYIEVSYALCAQSGYYSLTHKGNCKNHK